MILWIKKQLQYHSIAKALSMTNGMSGMITILVEATSYSPVTTMVPFSIPKTKAFTLLRKTL